MQKNLSDDEWRDLILSVGTHKKNRRLKPIEVSHYLARALVYHSIQSVCEKISLAKSNVECFLRLLELPKEIQPLIIWGRFPGHLSYSVAVEISHVKDPSTARRLAKKALEHGLNLMDVRATVQSMERTGTNLNDAVSGVINLKPRTENLVMFMGALPNEVGQRMGENVAKNKLRKLLSSKVGAENMISVSVNKGRFSFLLNVDTDQSLSFANSLNENNLKDFVLEILDS